MHFSLIRLKPAVCTLLLFVLLDANVTSAGQSQDTGWQTRPKITTVIELWPRTRLQNWIELQHGVNYSFQRWRSGAIVSRRMKPIVKLRRPEIDADRDNY